MHDARNLASTPVAAAKGEAGPTCSVDLPNMEPHFSPILTGHETTLMVLCPTDYWRTANRRSNAFTAVPLPSFPLSARRTFAIRSGTSRCDVRSCLGYLMPSSHHLKFPPRVYISSDQRLSNFHSSRPRRPPTPTPTPAPASTPTPEPNASRQG